MLTKLTVRNFKQFGEMEIALDNPVVFIGPNNSGKTTAMQALTLWQTGLQRWNERRARQRGRERRYGITIGRRDLVSIPVPDAKALWRQLHIRDSATSSGQQRGTNVRIEIIVEGETDGKPWQCGLEFDYANPESIYCRPLRLNDSATSDQMPIPSEMGPINVALLPPMSGLTETEDLLQPGAINVRIGQGRTAEVLRNLCHQVYEQNPDAWITLTDQIRQLFDVQLDAPQYIADRGQIVMTYRERGVPLDLSAAGRGLQQTLLLLAYIYTKPRAVLLLDEPDAHLEILRQRENYNLIGQVAKSNGNQLIIATHSEVLLNEAAGKDTVIAFVGQPHPLNGQKQEVVNALAEFGFQHYLQAEETKWVLYLEGPTDLAILRSFADRLRHSGAQHALARPFIHYVGNQPTKAQRHFHSLRIAVPDLAGVALFDNLRRDLPNLDPLMILMWQRNEIENYLASQATLEFYATRPAAADSDEPLFTHIRTDERAKAMRAAIEWAADVAATRDQPHLWAPEAKASDEVLLPIFNRYFDTLNVSRAMPKKNFYQLAEFIPDDEIDPEITEKLTAIAAVAEAANPPGLP